jgi:DHA1 family tetracycline resistance protein-like MFS transporter
MSQTGTSRFALAFIFTTMLLDTIGLGIIIPVTPTIIAELTGNSAHSAGGIAVAARYGGWLMFVYAAMQFLFAPLIGNLSDRFGRKPVLILSLLALAIDYLITGLAPTVGWLFLGRALSGGAGAAYSTANAYIADVTPPEKRAAAFGLTGAAFGVGFVIGPVIGGLLGQYGARLPFFVSAAVSLANALFGLVVLKESLPKSLRRKFELARSNPLGALTALRRYPMMLGLIGVVILMQLAHDANPSVFTYYVMVKFHWTMRDVGIALGVLGILIAFVFGVLPGLLVPRIGETACVYVGLAIEAIGFAGYAFATEGWQMYAWMAFWVLSGLAGPSVNAIMSHQIPPDEQGALQGAVASANNLTSTIAPVLLTGLFSYFTGPSAPVYFPGAAFLAAGAAAALALVLFAAMQPRTRAAAETA